MPSLHIHLSIAKEYIRKHENEIENEDLFIYGSLYPDLVYDKKETHYGKSKTGDLNYNLHNKINLEKFYENNNIECDFKKGFLLHILSDYVFYNYFFDEEYINKTTYREHSDMLTYSYLYFNKILEEKYDLGKFVKYIYDVVNKLNLNVEEKNKVLNIDKEKLFSFIDLMSSIDLEEHKIYKKC